MSKLIDNARIKAIEYSYNVYDVHEVLGLVLERLKSAEDALKKCGIFAGHISASEGCVHICKEVNKHFDRLRGDSDSRRD